MRLNIFKDWPFSATGPAATCLLYGFAQHLSCHGAPASGGTANWTQLLWGQKRYVKEPVLLPIT